MRPPDAELQAAARALLRRALTASLATLAAEGPFASLVTVATDPAGAPLLLLSDLSAHTRHLRADPRLSLLLVETGKGDPLAHPRLTLGGTATRLARADDAAARARFLRRHPKAALYADFGDFAFWRLEPIRIHYNGGFARAADWPAPLFMTDVTGAAALIAAEAAELARLNAGNLAPLAGRPGAWVATGLDPDGLDLVWGRRTTRIAFAARVTDPAALAGALPPR